jgi:hypothetical protein
MWFVNYFLSTFCKMLQHFLKILDNIFLNFLGFFKHFSEMLQHFKNNVGFVNYFLSTFCKILQHFLEMLGKK